MKKYLLLILVALIAFNVKALEIKDLGFKSKDIKDFTFYTRKNYKDTNFMIENDIFAIGESEGHILYIRAITNPGIVNYEAKADLVDEVFGLIDKVNTTKYAYVIHKDYKWIRFDYVDKNNTPILEYFISWKDIFITITLVGEGSEIPYDTKNEVDKFVESIELNGKGKVPVSNIYKAGIDYFQDNKKEEEKSSYIVLVLMCLCAIGITWFATGKKN
jgi:hypothetical protein